MHGRLVLVVLPQQSLEISHCPVDVLATVLVVLFQLSFEFILVDGSNR